MKLPKNVTNCCPHSSSEHHHHYHHNYRQHCQALIFCVFLFVNCLFRIRYRLWGMHRHSMLFDCVLRYTIFVMYGPTGCIYYNTYIETYLRLSQCILYSIAVVRGIFNILRNVSRIRVVLVISVAVRFHTDKLSSCVNANVNVNINVNVNVNVNVMLYVKLCLKAIFVRALEER